LYLALSWFCFLGTNFRPVSCAQCVVRDLMPRLQQSTILNGPQSTYVWFFCCTSEIYTYQALIEAIGRNVDHKKWRFLSTFIIMLRHRQAATPCGDH